MRVSSKIPEPSRGWAGVNGSSVGKVKKVEGSKGHEEVTVNFQECNNWIGYATELELDREPRKGDHVQVTIIILCCTPCLCYSVLPPGNCAQGLLEFGTNGIWDGELCRANPAYK